jgi:hypothetical protein
MAKKINTNLRDYLLTLKPDQSLNPIANTGSDMRSEDLTFYTTGEPWSEYDQGTFLTENTEERRSRNQGGWDTLKIGTARLAGKTLTKLAESAGFVAGLTGIDNRSDEYGGGVSGWIAGAADNGLSVVARELEQNLEDATPLYNSIADKEANKANLFHNLADGDFWAGDAVDAGAFLASAWLTGSGTAALKLGERAALKLAKNVLTKGLVAGKLAKVANATNLVTATALNTASESMFEAKDVRDSLREQKAQEKYGMSYDMLREDTKQELNKEVAPAAAKTFALNSLLLAGPNLLEMKSLMKMAGRSSSEVTGLTSKGFNTSLEEASSKIKLPFGQSVDTGKVPYLGKAVKGFNRFASSRTGSNLIAAAEGIAREGGEENLQLAISNLIENDPDADLLDISTYGNIARNAVNNFYSDEGKKSMLLGSIIGGISNTASNNIDYSRNKKRQDAAILETNKAGANLFASNDIYEKEQYTENVDGQDVTKTRYKLDDQGNPIVDSAKVKALADQKAKFEYLDDIATLAEENGNDVLANLAKSNAMANWVKVHYDSGTEDLLNAKIAHLEQLSDKEYLEQGLDPREKTKFIAELKNKVQSYKKLARTIDSSLVNMDNSKQGSRNFLNRKSELYNLGTTLEDINSERNRLAQEKLSLESSPEMSTLNQKRLAYIDLKTNELNEAESKFREEFNKLADANKGQNYYNKDYKKSALVKTDSFNPETVTLEDFNNYEKSKLFSKKLGVKGENIENEFFEKGVEERLQTEDAKDILNDLLENKIPVSEKTKKLLNDELQEEYDELVKIAQTAGELSQGGEVDAPQYIIDEANRILADEDLMDEFNNRLLETEQTLNKINNLKIKEKSEVNDKTIKEKLIEGFTKLTKGILFNFDSNPDYDNLSELEKQERSLTNMVKVLKEKEDDNYSDIIKKYNEFLEKTKEAIAVVKERINDKNTQQEKIVNSVVEGNVNRFGINQEGKVLNQKLYDFFKAIIGDPIDKIANDIKDLTPWGKIGYLANVLITAKPQIGKEQLDLLKSMQNDLADNLLSVLSKNLTTTSLNINKVKELYKTNPKLVFKEVVDLLRVYSKDKNDPYNNFTNDFDFFKLKTALQNPEVKSRIDFDSLQKVLDLHQQILAIQETMDFVNSKENIVSEIVSENALSLDDKNITPSNQQILAIRDLIRFLFTDKKPEGFSSLAYLKGYAGTGKTNIVLKWFTKLSGLKTDEIFATGHNEYSSKAINDSIGTSQTRSIAELKQALNTNLGNVKLIVIDEINGLSFSEIKEIVELLNKYNIANKTSIKLIGLGDPNQVTTSKNAVFSPLDSISKDNHELTLITPLTIRYRSNVSAVVEAQDLFMGQPKDVVKNGIFVSSNASKTLGAEGSMSSTGIEESLKQRDLNDGKTRAIIVHPNDVQKWKDKNLGVEVVSYVDVQGRTLDEVFIDIPQSNFEDVFMYNQAMYTAASRATNFIFFQGIKTENIVDDTVTSSTEKATESLKNARKEFQKNREDELAQLDKDVVLNKTKPADPDPDNKPSNKKDDVDPDDDGSLPDTEEEEIEVEEVVTDTDTDTEASPIITGVNLKYPNKNAITGRVDEGLNIDIPPVEAGEEVFYIPTLNRQGFKSIGIYVNRDGNFLEVGILSQEELNNPPANKINEYKKLKEALDGPITEFVDDKNGYKKVSVNTSLNIVAKGKIENASPLKYIYGKIRKVFNLEEVLNLFKSGFFTTGESINSKIDESQIRIFTNTEIKELKSQGVTTKLVAGIPYVMIESPTQQGGKYSKPQFIKLDRKMLNKNDHSFLLNHIYDFINNYNKFRDSLPDLSVSQIADILDSSGSYLDKVLEEIEKTTGKKITLTIDQLELRKSIDEALHEPLSAEQLIVKKGVRVKNIKDPFMLDGKEIKGKVESVDNGVATVTVNGSKVKIPVEDLKVSAVRRPGKAQHAFNLIARGNRKANGYIIRLVTLDKDGNKISRGKSLLPRFDDQDFNGFVEKFNKMSNIQQQKALKKYEIEYNEPFENTTENAKKLMLLVNTAMTPSELSSIFSVNDQGNVSDLRVPIIRQGSFEDLGNQIRLDFTKGYIPSNNDSLFFETNFEGVKPTSVSVTLDSIADKPSAPDVQTPTARPRPGKRLKLLSKEVKSELGEKMSKQDILSYLQSIDKTLTPEEVKFVTESELLRISEGNESWGLYKNGILYLSQDNFDMAYKNVARHELFHRIFDMMLTDSQKELVYKKAIQEFGLNPNTELDEIEEVLAVKYQEFRNNKPISSFFKTLFNKIKRFLGMSSNLIPSIDEFFANMDSGLFDEVVNLTNTTKNYNDIKKDFSTPTNFKLAQLFIINELKNLQDINNNINSGYLPISTEEMINTIYQNVLEDHKYLSEQKELTEEDKEDLTIMTILKNRRIFNELVEDMFEGLKVEELNVTTDNSDILGSDWTDDINDAEQTDHESKLSTKVKQFLSTLVYDEKQINPRYAFLLCLETLSNISGTNVTEIRNLINDRFKAFELAKNNQALTVKDAIIDLISFAYAEDIKGVKINPNYAFLKENVFQDKVNKRIIRKSNNQSNEQFIKNIAALSGLSEKEIAALYINYNAQNTFLELYSQVASLYKQDVYQGIYSGGKENYSQVFKRVTQEAQITASNNNLSSNFLFELANGKVEDKPKSIWAKQQLIAALKSNVSEKEKVETAKKVFKALFNSNLIDTSNIDTALSYMYDLVESYLQNVNSDEELEQFSQNFVKSNNGRLSELSARIVVAENELRNPNYKRGDGKTAYLFTLASQAINTIQYLANPKLFPEPDFLKSKFFKQNIFLNGISKIYGYVNFDSVKSDYNDKNIRYKNETELDWVRRNFKYFFLAHSSDSKGTYIQQFLTISNKPNIIGAKVSFLNWNEIEKSIMSILEQQNSRDFSGVKVNNRLNVFDKLVKRKDGITDAQYTKEIIQAIKEKEDTLRQVLETENYTDAKNLSKAADDYTNGDVNSLMSLYYANFYINSHQLNQLVAGDEAFYKNSFDVIKRMSIAFATGYRGLVAKFALPKTYRTLVVKDIKGILGEDFQSFQKVIGKDFDLTDAQGYMTPKRAAELRKSFGNAFKFGSVIKPVHFEIDENGIPRAVKYSCIELTDELCGMFPKLKQVRDVLDANKIDEMVFESAVKVGKPLSIMSANSDGTLPSFDENSVLTLQNANYRIQSNPEHSVENDTTAFPTQLGYFFNFSGQNPELAEELFTAMESLMSMGLNETLGELGMIKRVEDEDRELTQNNQREKVRQATAKQQANDRNQRELEFLNNPKLGINTPFLVNKVITTLASAFSKATVAIRLPGAGLVLQSAYGTAEFTDKDGNLVKRDLKWRDKDGFAEVILPDFWKGKFKEGDEIMFDTMVGFRIPSTELHSAIPLKVVGFYPNNKNVIIAPKEIVYFHGSDYDVDKLYVMRRDTFSNKKSILTLDGKELYKGGTTTPTTKEFRTKLREEKILTYETLLEARKAKDSKKAKFLSNHLNDLKKLEESYYKNVIVESFVKVTTAKVNENLMMSPISMERFKGAGIEDETTFDLVARLKGFKTPKPKLSEATTLEAYNEAVDKWLKERNDVIFKERDLYDVTDQLAMHQDNFSGTKLTGMFANLAKSVAYFFQSTTDGKYPKLKPSYHIILNGKTYDGFDYYEDSKDITVNYNEKGEPIKSKPLITETIDSLVNAAIDNVKEQILPIIGFTNNLGNSAVSLVAMGMPLNDVVLVTTQPILDVLNQSTSFDRGYLNASMTIWGTLNGMKALTETDKEKIRKEVEEVEITTKKLEANYGKDLGSMTREELIFQLAVLDNVLKPANKIGDSLNTASTAYSVLKKMPVEFHGMQNTLEAFDNLWDSDTNKPGRQLVFENVDPIKLPHINKAFKILQTLKSKIEHLFYVHNKILQDFSSTVGLRSIVELDEEKNAKEVEISDFSTTKNDNEYLSKLRAHIIHYLMTGLTYTTPEGYTITNSTLNEPVYKTASGRLKTGLEAFNYRFKDSIIKLNRENPKNKFLKAFYINNKGKLIFNGAKNLDQADMLTFKNDFLALKEDGKYTQFQYEFVKFAVINQGLSFGSNNYSLILPDDIYEPMMGEFNKYFNELTGNPEKFKKVLDAISLNFKLQYALNTGITTVKYLKKDEYEKSNSFNGIVLLKDALNNDIQFTPKLFVRVYNSLYVLMDSQDLKYAYVGEINESATTYQYDSSLLSGNYSYQEAFNLNYPIVKVDNNLANTFTTQFKYEIGKKIRLVNYSDITRLNMKEVEIEKADFVDGRYVYTVKNPTFVSTIVSDAQLSNTEEFRNLIALGYAPEVALHKLKNNC